MFTIQIRILMAQNSSQQHCDRRRIPPFPIRMWNMYTRVINRITRTKNSVEGWHNAFNTRILGNPHLRFAKFIKYIRTGG